MNEIKEKIEKIVMEIRKDPKLLTNFKNEPVKVVEQLLGVDLPDALIKNIIDGAMDALKDDKKDDKFDLDDAAKLLKKLF